MLGSLTATSCAAAILFSVSVFGPAVGYLLGSVVLQFYVDLDKAALGKDNGVGGEAWLALDIR